MNRLTWDNMFLSMAGIVSTRSSCSRLQVGCIITDIAHEQIWMGYNGNYRGGPNECDSTVPGRCGCVHAEENAVIKAPSTIKDKIVYTTHAPCLGCAKKLINSGIARVVYTAEYRSTDGIELLKYAGIPCTWVPAAELDQAVEDYSEDEELEEELE